MKEKPSNRAEVISLAARRRDGTAGVVRAAETSRQQWGAGPDGGRAITPQERRALAKNAGRRGGGRPRRTTR